MEPLLFSKIQSALRGWYRRVRRDLPWRRSRDPWAILVSEVMLQQTRVETVIPYYERFLARFPTPAALAEAGEAEVLGYWSGLGYYRRARYLMAAADRIIAEHGGRFPEDFDAIHALPGVGRYTAGAVASIAFDVPVPVVDGNVIRVLARVGRISGDPTKSVVSQQIWAMAADLVDPDAPGESNQALMELGATICSKAAPLCVSCPIATSCEAVAEGEVSRYPETGAGRPAVQVRLAALAVLTAPLDAARCRVLLIRRGERDRMAGLLDLPAIELSPRARAPAPLRLLAATLGWEVGTLSKGGTVRHAITHHRVQAEVYVTVGKASGTGPRSAELPGRYYQDRIAPTAGPAGQEVLALQDAVGRELSSLGRKLLDCLRER